mmetsp:Transcript_55179/g.158677  ORF Transcript_55179/g.158677 Transcript_55179/m.158677 type:complete len:280 (+) Transcript_55179:931-1770(+)
MCLQSLRRHGPQAPRRLRHRLPIVLQRQKRRLRDRLPTLLRWQQLHPTHRHLPQPTPRRRHLQLCCRKHETGPRTKPAKSLQAQQVACVWWYRQRCCQRLGPPVDRLPPTRLQMLQHQLPLQQIPVLLWSRRHVWSWCWCCCWQGCGWCCCFPNSCLQRTPSHPRVLRLTPHRRPPQKQRRRIGHVSAAQSAHHRPLVQVCATLNLHRSRSRSRRVARLAKKRSQTQASGEGSSKTRTRRKTCQPVEPRTCATSRRKRCPRRAPRPSPHSATPPAPRGA